MDSKGAALDIKSTAKLENLSRVLLEIGSSENNSPFCSF
jgi:hypothetical protein